MEEPATATTDAADAAAAVEDVGDGAIIGFKGCIGLAAALFGEGDHGVLVSAAAGSLSFAAVVLLDTNAALVVAGMMPPSIADGE